jgi:hypothetical protein
MSEWPFKGITSRKHIVPQSGSCGPLHERRRPTTSSAVPAASALQASKRLGFGLSLRNGLRRFGQSCVSARRGASLCSNFRTALIGIFFAVDRGNVRRIFIEIGSADRRRRDSRWQTEGFAMGYAIPIRTDYTAGEVRRFAQRAKDAAQARRLLAIAAVPDGASREEAARAGSLTASRGFPLGAALLSLRQPVFEKGVVRAVPHQMSRVRQPYREDGNADNSRRQLRVRQGDRRYQALGCNAGYGAEQQ